MTTNSYSIPADFLQAVVNNLNQQPALHSRELLNYIEQICKQQDAEKAQKEKEAEHREVLRAAEEARENSLKDETKK